MRALALVALGCATLLCRCDNMSDQPKQKSYGPLVGPAETPDHVVEFGKAAPEAVPELTLALLQRGQERFRIYCTPCHSELGNGQGMIAQRGFPPPPSYHIDRLRE